MSTARKTFDRNYNDLLEFASDNLPENYSIDLHVIEGEASMSLHGPHGIDCGCHPDDGDAVDHWVYYVNYARESEGLTEVSWDDYWAAKGGAI